MDNFSIIIKIIRGSIFGILIGVIAGIAIPTAGFVRELSDEAVETVYTDNEGYEQDVLNNFFRFHVRSNSDSEDDLNLKYKVRDAILEIIGDELEGAQSKDEAVRYINENIDLIKTIAANEIEREGYDYDVKAYVGYEYFPMRQYGEVTFPAGIYETLRVDIGEAKGQNFWCLLYPDVCYPVEAYAVVSKDDAKELEDELKDGLNNELKKENKAAPKDEAEDEVIIGFKFVDWLKEFTIE